MSTTRYIEIPNPELAVGDAGPRSYTYFDLLEQFVWNRAEWRKDEAWFAAWERLLQAHEEAQKNDSRYVSVSGEDYDKFKPFATLQDIRIDGANVKPIVRLTRCVIFASTVKPDDIDAKGPKSKAVREEVNGAGATATTP